MTNILHISCSPRGKEAESFRLSQQIVRALLSKDPTAKVVERDLGDRTIAHVDPDYALSQGGPVDVSDAGTMVASEVFIRELEAAHIVVIGTPMHNLSTPTTLKAWLDHVVRARRTFNVTAQGKVGTLNDRPVFIAIASGGRFSGERARQPDFLTPYLTAVLGMIGLHNLTFFSVQGTGSGAEAVLKSRIEADLAIADYFAPPPVPAVALLNAR